MAFFSSLTIPIWNDSFRVEEPAALVRQTSDHCKTAEFPMKACWDEGESVTYEELKVKY